MGPHENQPVFRAGPPLDKAAGVMIMIHGRGAGPRDILGFGLTLDRPSFACIAPAAANNTWYPLPFISPREMNEPGLSSALGVIESLVTGLMETGVEANKIVLVGFSQGACLSSEFTIRHPRRYGGLLAFSGGLIGAPGTTWDEVTTPLDKMPVFLGCSDVDPHIPKERVIESEAVFKRLGARTKRILYPGMGHDINEDEIHHGQHVLDEVLAAP